MDFAACIPAAIQLRVAGSNSVHAETGGYSQGLNASIIYSEFNIIKKHNIRYGFRDVTHARAREVKPRSVPRTVSIGCVSREHQTPRTRIPRLELPLSRI